MMQKIQVNIKYFRLIFLLLLVTAVFQASTQEMRVVKRVKEYKKLVQKDSTQKMIELRTALPSIVYDLRYATKENFTSTKLYSRGDKTFARLAVVNALRLIQEELLKSGYGLKIWDAYRPYTVTKRMWELIGDDRYVADPAKGSNHNRGLAVDVTIVDLKTGVELSMGTGYDNFTDTAHHSFTHLPSEVLQNRKMLKEIMEKHGFRSLETEWWHYSFPNDKNYDVMDLSFKDLAKAKL